MPAPRNSKERPKGKPNPRSQQKQSERSEILLLQQAVDDFETTDVQEFADLPLSRQTLAGLSSAYYTKLTDIQARALPLALKGKDVLGAARTGSGKTLAFLIPVLEILLRKKWGPLDGLGALVISPTRELAVQIFEVLRKIGHHHQFSAGLVIGGKNLKDEQDRLSRMNILVATPGRLLQHMDQTLGFECDHLQLLVLDEADRILDMGFSASLNAIIANLPKSRQTLLFSATQTKSVKDLARLSLHDPEYVAVRENGPSGKGKEKAEDGDADEGAEEVPKNLEQHYMVVDLPDKLDLLWSFIKTHLFTKTIVFLSSGKQVRFVYENFRHMRPGVPLLHMHGKQKQLQRLEIYQRFLSAKHSILFATDIAARGLDFPAVDWVVQVDCPEDVETYIHRVGRTARYQAKGKALLFLLPTEEEGMLKRLESKRVEISKIKANEKKKQTIRSQLQSAAFQFPEIKFLAQRAFISYVRSVYLQKDKSIFRVDALPLEEYAASLGLAGAPKIKFVSKQEASEKKNMVRQVEELKKELEKGSEEESASEEENESEEESEDEDEDEDEEEEESTVAGPSSERDAAKQAEDEDDKAKANGVKTKYDRMFNRKSQTILSEHYTKLIDHSDDEDSSSKKPSGGSTDLVGGGDDDEDDFITLKRRDHTLNEAELPSSSFLSKRKLKMGQSKKAMLSSRGNPTKLVFDDEGDSHAIYELGDLEEFEKAGDAREQQREFVEAEREKIKQADVLDKERAKEKRREKKRKRKDIERETHPDGEGVEFSGDDEIVHPDFSGIDLPSASDDEYDVDDRPAPRSNKKQRRARFEDDDVERDEVPAAPKVNLEELALQALARRS
ncbi:hypothetical protein JCM21900_006237 [Sporobolomyces salmonicolor]